MDKNFEPVNMKGIATAPECDASKIDWLSLKGIAEGAAGGAFKAGMFEAMKSTTEKFLPETNIIGDLSKAKMNDVVKDVKSLREQQEVGEAAKLIAADPDLSAKHARDTVTRLFEDAEKKGPEAVAKLVKELNKSLEGSGTSVAYKSTFVPFSTEAGKVRILNEHKQIMTEISVADSNSPYKRGAL